MLSPRPSVSMPDSDGQWCFLHPACPATSTSGSPSACPAASEANKGLRFSLLLPLTPRTWHKLRRSLMAGATVDGPQEPGTWPEDLYTSCLFPRPLAGQQGTF